MALDTMLLRNHNDLNEGLYDNPNDMIRMVSRGKFYEENVAGKSLYNYHL